MMKNWQYTIYIIVILFLLTNALGPTIRIFGEYSQEVYSVLTLIVWIIGLIYRLVKSPKSSK